MLSAVLVKFTVAAWLVPSESYIVMVVENVPPTAVAASRFAVIPKFSVACAAWVASTGICNVVSGVFVFTTPLAAAYPITPAPVVVCRLPLWSSWKSPERVSCSSPPWSTTKKPLPFNAMSVEFVVVESDPCEKSVFVPDTCVPSPTCSASPEPVLPMFW